MNRYAELVKAIVVLPGSVLVLIPSLLLCATRPFHLLGGIAFPAAWILLGAGLFFTLAGILFSVWTMFLFMSQGGGTPAPWNPPKRFVVSGPYRYVRNPMILSVLSILAGEAIFFGSVPILIWGVVFWLLNTVYFAWVEEPGLTKRFGNDYLEYKRNVRRWIPRFTPWRQITKGR